MADSPHKDIHPRKVDRRSFMVAAAALAGAPGLALAQAAKRNGRAATMGIPRPPTHLAAYSDFSIALGRVTHQSAVLSLLSQSRREIVIRSKGENASRELVSQPIKLSAGKPFEFTFDNLEAGKAYRYSLCERRSDGALSAIRADSRLQTQRPTGAGFTFTVQGDSHPERPQMFDSALYARTLQLIDGDHPDFHICMGDDFSLNTLREISEDAVRSRYELQRPFLGLVGHSAPVFLLNGNHEQASLFNFNQKGEPHDAAVWAQRARNELFPQPAPDGFYSGNEIPLDGIGPLRNYFAWTWGDALFVVLDNYWHSPACVDTQLRGDDQKRAGKNRDGWGITLGDAQYQWFKKTLESSQAKFKFVFAHHVLGTGRGGIERATFFEWGGKSNRGLGEFATHRKNWALPIHQLMVKTGVTIFFQGHDHLYARQELDGVVYQTTPIPADPNYSIYNADRYLSGVKHPNSGYLRVTVKPETTRVDYVRSYLQDNLPLNQTHGEVTHTYTVNTRAKS